MPGAGQSQKHCRVSAERAWEFEYTLRYQSGPAASVAHQLVAFVPSVSFVTPAGELSERSASSRQSWAWLAWRAAICTRVQSSAAPILASFIVVACVRALSPSLTLGCSQDFKRVQLCEKHWNQKLESTGWLNATEVSSSWTRARAVGSPATATCTSCRAARSAWLSTACESGRRSCGIVRDGKLLAYELVVGSRLHLHRCRGTRGDFSTSCLSCCKVRVSRLEPQQSAEDPV